MFSLDTTTVVDFLRRPSPGLLRRVGQSRDQGTLGISAIVLFELSYGAARRVHPTHASRLSDFLGGGVAVMEFDADDAAAAGALRALLEAEGRGIGPFDTLIAAQARRRAFTLVTSNTREFERVPGLVLEDWRA